MSIDILQRKIIEKQNPTVAGLDPRPEYVPEEIRARHFAEKGETLEALADAYLEFNKGLMDALADVIPAVKPQSAYYEMLGWEGVRCLKQTIDYARSLGHTAFYEKEGLSLTVEEAAGYSQNILTGVAEGWMFNTDQIANVNVNDIAQSPTVFGA